MRCGVQVEHRFTNCLLYSSSVDHSVLLRGNNPHMANAFRRLQIIVILMINPFCLS
jgi:hypothetical protein